MTLKPNYDQIARSYELWQIHAAPWVQIPGYPQGEEGCILEEFEFYTMRHADRVDCLIETFGPEERALTVDDVLARTVLGNGYHSWGTNGSLITVRSGKLRQALEAAYDPTMPDWPAMVEID